MICFRAVSGSKIEQGNLYDLIQAGNDELHVNNATTAIGSAIVVPDYFNFNNGTAKLVHQEHYEQIGANEMASMGYLSGCAVLVALSEDRNNPNTWVYHAPGGITTNAGEFIQASHGERYVYIIPHEGINRYIGDIDTLVTAHQIDPNSITIIGRTVNDRKSDVHIRQNGDFGFC